MPFMVMQHEVDPKQKLLDELGDISNVEIFNNQLLVAVYIRPKKTKSGIILADEISPDGCRLWDMASGEKLDKDRFRRDLGGEVEAYQEVARRLGLLPDGADSAVLDLETHRKKLR